MAWRVSLICEEFNVAPDHAMRLIGYGRNIPPYLLRHISEYRRHMECHRKVERIEKLSADKQGDAWTEVKALPYWDTYASTVMSKWGRRRIRELGGHA